MEHVTSAQIDAFRHNRLADPERRTLIAHLAGCRVCSDRVAADPGVRAAAGALGDDLAGGGEHPDIEELFAFVDGDLPGERRNAISDHLRRCARCREDVDDASNERSKMRHHRTSEWFTLAAAVLIAVLAAAWWLLRPAITSRPSASSTAHTIAPERPRSPFDAITEDARRSGTVAMPSALLDLRGNDGQLRGGTSAAADYDMHPAGVVVATDRPELTWRETKGRRFVATVMCNDAIAAVSAPVGTGRWSPPNPLPRGSRCLWQLERLPDHQIIPQPPAAQPAFRVMDAQTLASIGRADGDDFLTGILYARAGAQQEAEEHLQRWVQAHPDDAAARTILESIRRW